ncbi:DoxX family protein [Streptomyces sp. O3]
MSVDTRTPRTPTGGASGFDDGRALSMVKVPCDPAQVIVNHASFRVQLSAAQPRSPRIARPPAGAAAQAAQAAQAARVPVGAAVAGAAGAAGAAAVVGRRRSPVVWSGKSAPGDLAATGLLQAVRSSGVRHGDTFDDVFDADATQAIPRVDAAETETVETPQVYGQRGPSSEETRALPVVPAAGDSYADGLFRPDSSDSPDSGSEFGEFGELGDYADDAEADVEPVVRRRGADPVRHAYYPGRRMNLGVVLLPLRVFLGFISIYAGMGKLCDPVYFDGGERGSMVTWLSSLHPWELAEPMRDFALSHPVGAGLTVAFLQVIVGVLTVLGLWQRVAASVGALLSAALLVTVSWKAVPAYDTPDIIYLAAWSPLIIAGAPVYSVDGRLASEAWRRLGPRVGIWELRRRVLRRGLLIGTVVVGLTLLIGALLGSAVRDAGRVIVPGPGEPPRNVLPGSPLPSEPGARVSESQGQGQERERERERSESPSASSEGATRGNTSSPSTSSAATPEAARESSTAGAAEEPAQTQPSQTQGTVGEEQPQQSAPPPPPSTSAGPTSSGGTDSGGGSTGGPEEGDGGGGETSGPGLVGGLLG